MMLDDFHTNHCWNFRMVTAEYVPWLVRGLDHNRQKKLLPSWQRYVKIRPNVVVEDERSPCQEHSSCTTLHMQHRRKKLVSCRSVEQLQSNLQLTHAYPNNRGQRCIKQRRPRELEDIAASRTRTPTASRRIKTWDAQVFGALLDLMTRCRSL